MVTAAQTAFDPLATIEAMLTAIAARDFTEARARLWELTDWSCRYDAAVPSLDAAIAALRDASRSVLA